MAQIIVERQWIASSNAEWLAFSDGIDRVRGGQSPSRAVARMAELHPELFAEGETVQIVIKRDTTTEQARRAHESFFGKG